MLARRLSKAGISSDVLHLAGFASILASIATWNGAKKATDPAKAERMAIFVGLWPPTFFALADLVATEEKRGVLNR